jgi:DNA-binding NarL/FixJ family response regulator
VKVIILTTFDNEEDLKQSLKAGAKGYLLKEAEKEKIADAIRTVAQGGNYVLQKFGEDYARDLLAAHGLPDIETKQLRRESTAPERNHQIDNQI